MNIELTDTFLHSYTGVACDGAALQMQTLLAELNKWNRAYNLTAIRDPQQQISAHILDSVSVLPYLQGDTILDVGSGPGFPGLPLAIMRPDLQFVLLDSNSKKTRFIEHIVRELRLDNVSVVTARLEEYKSDQMFTTITSRAFTSLDEFVQKSHSHCVKKGLLLAMKGRYPRSEIEALTDGYEVDTIAVEVPGLEAERHLVLIGNTI